MVCWHKRKCNHRVREYRESRERCHQRCNDVLRTHSLLPGSILLLAIFIFSIRHQAHFNRQQRLPTRLILVIIPGWALLVSCSAHISLHRHTTPPLHRSISRSGRKPQRGLATLSTRGDQKKQFALICNQPVRLSLIKSLNLASLTLQNLAHITSTWNSLL